MISMKRHGEIETDHGQEVQIPNENDNTVTSNSTALNDQETLQEIQEQLSALQLEHQTLHEEIQMIRDTEQHQVTQPEYQQMLQKAVHEAVRETLHKVWKDTREDLRHEQREERQQRTMGLQCEQEEAIEEVYIPVTNTMGQNSVPVENRQEEDNETDPLEALKTEIKSLRRQVEQVKEQQSRENEREQAVEQDNINQRLQQEKSDRKLEQAWERLNIARNQLKQALKERRQEQEHD